MQYDVVKGIEFKILSSRDIRQRAILPITSKSEFDGHVPLHDSFFDPRLGPVDLRIKCETCGLGTEECPGHGGFIEFPVAYYHPGFVHYLCQLLRTLCYFKSCLLIPDGHPVRIKIQQYTLTTDRLKELTKIANVSKVGHKTCPHCGAPKARYKKTSTSITREWKDVEWSSTVEEEFAALPFAPHVVKRILSGISDENLIVLGLTRDQVDALINDHLYVMAPKYRPMQNDLSRKLSKINEVNIQFKKRLQTDQSHHLLAGEKRFLEHVNVATFVSTVLISLFLQRFGDSAADLGEFVECDTVRRRYRDAVLITLVPTTAPNSTTKRGTKRVTKIKKIKKTRFSNDVDPSTESDDLVATTQKHQVAIDRASRTLQLQLGTYYNNEKQADTQSGTSDSSATTATGGASGASGSGAGATVYGMETTAKLKGLAQRLKGKPGRFRCNLSAKRVDFSGRGCIVPDGNLDLDQVGVPHCIALVLTIVETVNSINSQQLLKRVRLGYGQVKGAKSIWRHKTGTIKSLSLLTNIETNKLTLEYGDKVERYLQDEDIVLLNRQPSLHRQSIMAMRTKLVTGQTIKLNLTVTTPFNADFDGDEMNIHVPQSIEARAEAQQLMSVASQIMNPQNNRPLFGYKQDPLIGWFLLTSRDTFLTRQELMDLIMMVEYPDNYSEYAGVCAQNPNDSSQVFESRSILDLPEPAILKPKSLYTGKQVFSLLLPRILNYDKYVRDFQPDHGKSDTVAKDYKSEIDKKIKIPPLFDIDDRWILIQNGELLCGTLCKATLGASRKTLFHVLGVNYGQTEFVRFVSDAQRISNAWLLGHGFTTGISDLRMKHKEHQSILHTVDSMIDKLYDIPVDGRIRYRDVVNRNQDSPLTTESIDAQSVNSEKHNATSVNLEKINATSVNPEKIHKTFYKLESHITNYLNGLANASGSFVDCYLNTYQDSVSKPTSDGETLTSATTNVNSISTNTTALIPSKRTNNNALIPSKRIKATPVIPSKRIKATPVIPSKRINNLVDMTMCGSKGTNVNTYHMACLVGQNCVSGQRVNPIKSDYCESDLKWARSFPCSKPNVIEYTNTVDHGFVRNSYISGLDSRECTIQTSAGRHGLVTTAVNSSDFGYGYRKLVKGTESLAIAHDRTVRDISNNSITQYTYGTDGLESSGIQFESLQFLKTTCDKFTKFAPPEIASRLTRLQDEFVTSRMGLASDMEFSLSKDKICPVNSGIVTIGFDLQRQLDLFWQIKMPQQESVQQSCLLDKTFEAISKLSIIQIMDLYVHTLIGKFGAFETLNVRAVLYEYLYWKPLTRQNLTISNLNKPNLKNWESFLRSQLDPLQTNFDVIRFYQMIEHIMTLYQRSKIHGGEMVGFLAASSISEPAAQTTFNTFHYAGVAAKNLTGGYPRCTELFSCRSVIKTPSTLVVLKSGLSMQLVDQICNSLPATYFHSCANKGKIVAYKTVMSTLDNVSSSDDKILDAVFDANQSKLFDMSHMCLTYVLKMSALEACRVDEYDVCRIIKNILAGQQIEVSVAHVISNKSKPSLTTKLVFRIAAVEYLQQIQIKTAAIGENNNNERTNDTAIDPNTLETMTVNASTPKSQMSEPATVALIRKNFEIKKLQQLQSFLNSSIVIQGVPNIQTVVKKDKPFCRHDKAATGANLETQASTSVMLETHGTASSMPLLWLLDSVDWKSTISNDVCEIVEHMGIECAGYVLFQELKKVLYQFDSNIDERHLLLLTDQMIRSGFLMPMDRHGFKNAEHSVLEQASFEKQADVLYEAAFNQARDACTGVTGSLYMGQTDQAQFGTGLSVVLFPKSSSGWINGLAGLCRNDDQNSIDQRVSYKNMLVSANIDADAKAIVDEDDNDLVYQTLARLYLPESIQEQVINMSIPANVKTQNVEPSQNLQHRTAQGQQQSNKKIYQFTEITILLPQVFTRYVFTSELDLLTLLNLL